MTSTAAHPQARTGLQLRTLARNDGTLELSLASVPVPPPAPDEVVIRVEAAPINPSDLGLLFGPADVGSAKASTEGGSPVITASIPERLMRTVAGRLGQSLPAGNEGAGVVIDTGSSPEAQRLLGKTVAILGGAMYAQYRTMKAKQCLLLPPGTTAAEGAACFVNPLTVLGMVETMRRESHTAIVHTAAASNLGQMLQKLCIAEKIPLVNIVRKPEQETLLRGIGATHVCNSSSATFMDELTDALAQTGATIAFDATGGGKLASQILTAMEAAAVRNMKEFSRYGSTTFKQVYIYGGLDRSPTELTRNYGMMWSLGGWLLTPFLQKIGPEATQKLRERVAAEIKTTFASSYAKEISLAEALSLDAIAVYAQTATGKKYLINPNKGL
jgi:NADPH2:quinone reductase